MFSRNSPLKRKHNEFHDPDYPQHDTQSEEDDGRPGCSTNFINKRKKPIDGVQTEKETTNDNYVDKVRQLIDREFNQEILMKQQQLEEIDQRLKKAKHLLDRLRYGIVLAYYKKQEIPLTSADAAALRGANSLFEREDKGPQMPLHPSVKKLIGKRPKDLHDVIRTCPKRTAAKNAVQTIRAKSQVQKREEKKLKQIIRDQGIVIDHSKQNATDNDVNTLINAAAKQMLHSTHDSTITTIKQEKTTKESSNTLSGKSLNASRLNNKIKHLIVVGNTSKYIGNEVERDTKSQSKNLTFKWLVYVQSKEKPQPIERFIKKVRFYLHQSYRPNDVVDIESPPFQVSRRGWGEFPIRVQLFFHSELHQKPVQLIHNIILDKNLSGIQTLGAETLLEIWLRDVKSTNLLNKEVKQISEPEIENPTDFKTDVLTRTEELLDDNLLDFLNKIEASPCSISADIEKIQPTVVVNEPFGVKIKTPSPEKCKVFTPTQQKSPIKIAPHEKTENKAEKNLVTTLNPTSNSIVFVPQPTTSVSVSGQFKTPLLTKISSPSKPITTFVRLSSSSTETTSNNNFQVPPLGPITPLIAHAKTPSQSLPIKKEKPPIILNKDGKILMPSSSVASAVRKTTLPILNSKPTNISSNNSPMLQISTTNKPQTVSAISNSASMVFTAPKQILQKKLVQLIDSTGKVKYIQMLVAASSASTNVQNSSNSSVAPKLVTTAPLMKNQTVTKTTQITNTVTTPLLKTSNGVHLVPAKTMKPNIFKIVPESIQTKPQILTFSTTSVGTTNTNTLTTVNNQTRLQHSITTNTQSVGQITSTSGTTASKPINVTLPVANKLQKPNSNNTTAPTKNLVFQKEGKLYIIDPQQMKYKQQQKKQVSLLKPQISLLKQQQRKLPAPAPAPTGNSTADINKLTTATQLSNNNSNVPQVHFGLKQQRINAINDLQLIQMKRMLFEKQFLRQEFTNIRKAVEFLLRRLKIVVPKDSLVSAYPFVSHTLQEFHSLTAFKQRACEWLRAKNISRLLRNHRDLQRLHNTSKECFWSTKEIATFARQYAYTPPIKSLPRPGDQPQVGENNSKGFVDLVKSELRQENDLQYDTLTDHYKVRKWIDKVWHTLEDYEHQEEQHEIIDIDGIEEEDSKSKRNKQVVSSAASHISQNSLDTYLYPPSYMENQCQLVSDICKDLYIKLVHEKLDTNVFYPATHTILAHCLYLFIEKVLRQSVALKLGKSSMSHSAIDSVCTILPQDFAKVLTSNSEFDFLTNNNFGSAIIAECVDSSIKLENP